MALRAQSLPPVPEATAATLPSFPPSVVTADGTLLTTSYHKIMTRFVTSLLAMSGWQSSVLKTSLFASRCS
jgi:hypothetical protein